MYKFPTEDRVHVLCLQVYDGKNRLQDGFCFRLIIVCIMNHLLVLHQWRGQLSAYLRVFILVPTLTVR